MARRVASGLAARGLEVVAKFGLYALGAHALGLSDAGVFFLCLSLLHLLSTAARLGVERPLARHVAASMATGEPGAARKTAARGFAVTAASGLALAAALWLAAPLAAEVLFREPGLALPLRLLAFILPGHVLTYACGNVLVGLDKGASAQMLTNAAAPAVVLLAMVAGVTDLAAVMGLYGLAYWACFAVGLLQAWAALRAAPEAGTSAHAPLPPLLSEARSFFVVELSQAGLLSMPVLVLGRFAEPAQVSEFSIGSRLSMLVATLVLSMATMVAPRLAAHHRLGELDGVRSVMRQITLVSLGVCLPALALMALLREPLLKLMGAHSQTAEAALLWMLAGQLVIAALPARDTLLAMTGRGAALRNLSIAQVAVGLAASFWLVPVYGVLGAAWATTLTWLVGVLGCALLAQTSLRRLS